MLKLVMFQNTVMKLNYFDNKKICTITAAERICKCPDVKKNLCLPGAAGWVTASLGSGGGGPWGSAEASWVPVSFDLERGMGDGR